MSHDDDAEALEREFADVVGVLRRFEVAGPTPGLEERVAVKAKDLRPGASCVDAGALREPRSVSLRCAYCHAGLERPDAVFCASCLAPHHGDCFVEHGRCSAPGCAETRVVSPRPAGPAHGPPRAGRRSRWRPLLVAATLLVTTVLGVAALDALRERRRDAQDQLAEFEAFRRARDEATRAFAEFERARRSGDVALARQQHARASARFTEAAALLEQLLAPHRAHDHDGTLPPAYEGYASDQAEIMRQLTALERQASAIETARADALREEGSFEEAVAEYHRILERDPDHVAAHLGRGEALLGLGRGVEAEAHFGEALRRAADARGFYGYARALLQRGEQRAALADLSRALELDPEHADAFLLRGMTRVQLGDREGGCADLARFLALAPDDPEADAVRDLLRAEAAPITSLTPPGHRR